MVILYSVKFEYRLTELVQMFIYELSWVQYCSVLENKYEQNLTMLLQNFEIPSPKDWSIGRLLYRESRNSQSLSRKKRFSSVTNPIARFTPHKKKSIKSVIAPVKKNFILSINIFQNKNSQNKNRTIPSRYQSHNKKVSWFTTQAILDSSTLLLNSLQSNRTKKDLMI